MSIVFIIRNLDTVYIMIIDFYRFRFGRENIDWTTNIVYLYCNEMIEEFDYLEHCTDDNDFEPMDIENYYSDKEYWFKGDD